jgi:hypothetical protein
VIVTGTVTIIIIERGTEMARRLAGAPPVIPTLRGTCRAHSALLTTRGERPSHEFLTMRGERPSHEFLTMRGSV